MSGSRNCNPIRRLGPNGIIVKNSFCTEAVYKLNYIWVIKNYSSHHTKKSTLETPLFTADNNPKCKWYLKLLHPPKYTNEDVMGLYLHLHGSSECNKVFIKFKFSILDDELKEHRVSDDKMIREIGESAVHACWGSPRFVLNRYLSDKRLLPNDELTIYCEVAFSEVDGFIEISESEKFPMDFVQIQPDRSERCVSTDLRNLFENRKLTDVVLSVNGKEYRAHKVVLGARSPVFAAMFEHNMKENENNRVEIIDFEEKVIEEMLRYMYTDTCENLKDLAAGLLAASDKYDLQGLKIMCQEVLIDGLAAENAAETLNFAHLFSAAKLKMKTLDFIVANSVEVTSSADWKNHAPSYPQSLMMEIVETFSHQAVASLR